MHSKSRFGRTMTEEELETVKQKIELAEKVINTKNQRPDTNTDRNINYTNRPGPTKKPDNPFSSDPGSVKPEEGSSNSSSQQPAFPPTRLMFPYM